MDTYMEENTNIIYKKVWKIKQEQVKEDHILSGLEIVQDEDKSTRKKEDVRHRKVWRRN